MSSPRYRDGFRYFLACPWRLFATISAAGERLGVARIAAASLASICEAARGGLAAPGRDLERALVGGAAVDRVAVRDDYVLWADESADVRS
jgi:hypothetical protein